MTQGYSSVFSMGEKWIHFDENEIIPRNTYQSRRKQ